MFTRNPSPPRISNEIREALGLVQTSTLGHLQDHGFPRGLTPLFRPLRFVGTAVTVRLPHMDSTALHAAIDDLRPGDVIVIDQGNDTRSCFGGMMAFTAHHHGAVGAVVGGSINDYDELQGIGLPIFSQGVSALTTRIRGIEGAINVPVSIGGVVIRPGDVIFGDSDGIAVLDPEEALELAIKLRHLESEEPELRDYIRNGGRISDRSGATNHFSTTGS